MGENESSDTEEDFFEEEESSLEIRETKPQSNNLNNNDNDFPYHVRCLIEKIKKDVGNSQAEILLYELKYPEEVPKIEKYIYSFGKFLDEKIIRTCHIKDRIRCTKLRDSYNEFRKSGKLGSDINHNLFPILCHHFGIHKAEDRRLGYACIKFK